MTDNGPQRPYKPSWFDRFNDWVGTLPIAGWVFYSGLGFGLILVQVLFLWLDGGLDAAEVLLPLIIFNALSTPFILALIQRLDEQAVTALDSMRPALETTGPQFDEFRYKLSTMPSRGPLVAGLVTLTFLLLTELLGLAPVRFAALEDLPKFAIVFHILDKVPAFFFGGFFYHTIRQLRLVNTINSDHARISLFDLGPLQAFSRLTASTAVGLVIGVIGWMLINPDLLAKPLSLAFAGTYAILATAVFVWPLRSVHRLMEVEKGRALLEIDRRFEVVLARLNQLIDEYDYANTQALNGTIASLEIQYNRISAIPTWPWSPEIARIVLTAIALPLVLMTIQFFVLQALSR